MNRISNNYVISSFSLINEDDSASHYKYLKSGVGSKKIEDLMVKVQEAVAEFRTPRDLETLEKGLTYLEKNIEKIVDSEKGWFTRLILKIFPHFEKNPLQKIELRNQIRILRHIVEGKELKGLLDKGKVYQDLQFTPKFSRAAARFIGNVTLHSHLSKEDRIKFIHKQLEKMQKTHPQTIDFPTAVLLASEKWIDNKVLGSFRDLVTEDKEPGFINAFKNINEFARVEGVKSLKLLDKAEKGLSENDHPSNVLILSLIKDENFRSRSAALMKNLLKPGDLDKITQLFQKERDVLMQDFQLKSENLLDISIALLLGSKESMSLKEIEALHQWVTTFSDDEEISLLSNALDNIKEYAKDAENSQRALKASDDLRHGSLDKNALRSLLKHLEDKPSVPLNKGERSLLTQLVSLLGEEKIAPELQEMHTFFFNKAKKLHETPTLQNLGSVAIIDRKALPTKDQLKTAFQLAFSQMPYLMNSRSDMDSRIFAAHVIQVILCGQKVAGDLPFPSNDSFQIKEIKDREKVAATPIRLAPGESFLSFHISSQKDTVTFALNDFFSKEFKQEGVPLFKSALHTISQNTVEFDQIKTILRNAVAKDIFPTNSEYAAKLMQWIDRAEGEDLRRLQKAIKEKSIIQYLGNFLYDCVQRKNYTFSLNKKEFEVFKKQAGVFFRAYRKQLFNELIENPLKIQELLQSNREQEQSTGIPHDLTKTTLDDWMIRSKKKPIEAEDILQYTTFTGRQLKKLAELSGVPKKQIEPLLRVKALQLMIVANQSTQALEALNFDPAATFPLQSKFLNPPLEFLTAHYEVNIRTFVLSPSLNALSVRLGNTLVIATDEAREKKFAVPSSFRGERFPLGTLVKETRIDTLTNASTEEVGTFYEYKDFGVNPNMVDHMDDLMTLFPSVKK